MPALQFLDGTLHYPEGDDVYVRVRLTDPTSAGEVTVYLADGTALMVPASDLLRPAPAHDTSEVTA